MRIALLYPSIRSRIHSIIRTYWTTASDNMRLGATKCSPCPAWGNVQRVVSAARNYRNWYQRFVLGLLIGFSPTHFKWHNTRTHKHIGTASELADDRAKHPTFKASKSRSAHNAKLAIQQTNSCWKAFRTTGSGWRVSLLSRYLRTIDCEIPANILCIMLSYL